MPNRDGTGPMGKGSKTWAQKGNCEWAQYTEFSRGKGNKWCGRKKWEGNRLKVIDTTTQE